MLVLGDMGELGGDAAVFHAKIGNEARRAGIEKLYALGTLSHYAVSEFGSGAQHFERIEDLQDSLEKELDKNTTVLVKGSRFMKMERVVNHFEEGSTDSTAGRPTGLPAEKPLAVHPKTGNPAAGDHELSISRSKR